MLLGPLGVEPSWSGPIHGRREWQRLRAVTDYLARDFDGAPAKVRSGGNALAMDDQMQEVASLLRSHFAEIEPLFGAGDLGRERPEFEEYVRQRGWNP